jgi:hypothetical protein
VIVLQPAPAATAVAETNLRVQSFDGTTLVGSAAVATATVYALVGTKKKRLSAKARKPVRPLKLAREWSFRLENDNALLLDAFRMLPEEQLPSGAAGADPATDDGGWLAVKPGAWEMQLPQERDAATYPVVLWYRTRFEADVVPEDLRLLVDGFSGSTHDLFVNGARIEDRGRRSALDAEIKEIDLARHVHPGTNLIAVRLTAARRTDGILDPLKLVGDFAVRTGDGPRLVARPDTLAVGDWTKQGFPYFSGTAVYTTEVTLPAAFAGGRITLEAECGDDVLEVLVNDAPPVVLPWHPYTVDVTEALRPGTNRITLKVTNTLINLLEGVRRPSGLFGVPRLLHEHVYTLTLPAPK